MVLLSSLDNLRRVVYSADTPYAYCEYYENERRDTMFVAVRFRDNLRGVSAMHIHSSQDPNPVLVWLLTSNKWESGVAQTSFQSNAPCCSNHLCNLQSPSDDTVPYVEDIDFEKTYHFTVRIPLVNCSSATPCPWTSQGTSLNVHGIDFQSYDTCVMSKGQPGADMIFTQVFVPINNDNNIDDDRK